MAKICLSYDATIEYYDANFTRGRLIKLLLINGATNMESHVASSVYFDTNKRNSLEKWDGILKDEFPDFRFTIAKVVTSGNAKSIWKKTKSGFRGRFANEVNKAERSLKRKGIL